MDEPKRRWWKGGRRPKEEGTRFRRLTVNVDPQHIPKIETYAKKAGLSVSAYFVAAALRHRTKSVYDLDVLDHLIRVCGQLASLIDALRDLNEPVPEDAVRLVCDQALHLFASIDAELGIRRQ